MWLQRAYVTVAIPASHRRPTDTHILGAENTLDEAPGLPETHIGHPRPLLSNPRPTLCPGNP